MLPRTRLTWRYGAILAGIFACATPVDPADDVDLTVTAAVTVAVTEVTVPNDLDVTNDGTSEVK